MVTQITTASDNLAHAGERNAAAATELSSSASEVSHTVADLQKVAELLSGHVSRFVL